MSILIRYRYIDIANNNNNNNNNPEACVFAFALFVCLFRTQYSGAALQAKLLIQKHTTTPCYVVLLAVLAIIFQIKTVYSSSKTPD